MSYCWKDGSAELAAGDDLLSSAAALQEVCRMENVVMGLESYDAFCYNAPEPFCLGEGSAFCAPDGKSTSAVTGRSCSPMLVSPLPYFYTEWQALPNASVLLASLEGGEEDSLEDPSEVLGTASAADAQAHRPCLK